jgi:dihydrofolate reductase
MSRTQYYTATSLDGYIADSAHSLDWLFALGDPVDSSYPAFIANVGAVAMGSSTYAWILRHAIHADPPQPWPYALPTWVFTSRPLEIVPDADVRFVSGDVRPIHDAMQRAANGRNIWIAGGGDLVGQFHDAGLLDDLIVQIGSVTLGGGKPLLPRRIEAPTLALQSARQMGTGFVELHYAVGRRG